jgi:two-component system, NarL family, sensor kinase
MRVLPLRLGGPSTDEYGVRVADTSDAELHRARRIHQLRSYRIASVIRIGVVGLMVAAMLIGTPRFEWPPQTVLIALYAVIALCALARAFSPFQWLERGRLVGIGRLEPFAFTIVDVITVTVFQVLSTDRIDPLLIMMLLPIFIGLDVSSRRAAVVLACSMAGFLVAVLEDPFMKDEFGLAECLFRFSLYAGLCATAYLAVRMEERHTRAIAGLSALREELLAQTMTASDVLQRRISESIHDGPLQDVLAVRQEVVELRAAYPGDERVERALTGLQVASQSLRQATFELHPAVLEQAGLGAAVQELASYTQRRSGIEVSTDIDYPIRDEIDRIVFGVVRELLSNAVHHSKARHASVTLGVTDGKCVLNVTDDGVGFDAETMARRLGEGHIGLESHRTRVDAAGGIFLFLDAPVGTHICVEVPLKG